ncbi:hypothetical protein E2C01_102875 [Portunus trituberculatus]|uniref:Uncharacterized protein n=1 Tax=Portunus trituberculatus TaxID=210409 RepID=A0A5B7KJE7_PORTR|nr:hypothetical protein [Portunus trituberculatus]
MLEKKLELSQWEKGKKSISLLQDKEEEEKKNVVQSQGGEQHGSGPIRRRQLCLRVSRGGRQHTPPRPRHTNFRCSSHHQAASHQFPASHTSSHKQDSSKDSSCVFLRNWLPPTTRQSRYRALRQTWL